MYYKVSLFGKRRKRREGLGKGTTLLLIGKPSYTES